MNAVGEGALFVAVLGLWIIYICASPRIIKRTTSRDEDYA